MGMARLKKSARGKHRWVGFTVDQRLSREDLDEFLSTNLDLISWRLFDILESNGKTISILKVPLVDFQATLSELNDVDGISTLTSSGKIKLVRKRIIELGFE